VKGFGSSWDLVREPLVYWSAWALVLSLAGATVMRVSLGWRGNGGVIYILVWRCSGVGGEPF